MLVPLEKTAEAFHSASGNARRLTLLGSTGSIGTQTLSLVKENRDRFSVFALAAHKNYQLLAEQILEFSPRHAVIIDGNVAALREQLSGHAHSTELHGGEDVLSSLVRDSESDLTVAALVGFAGVPSLLAAVEAGKSVALANKESLVAAGALVRRAAECSGNLTPLLPVDSEHSAIFQCLLGSKVSDIRNLTLTASGGPFRDKPLEELKNIRPQEAVRHPNWSMGAKVSVDSATMFNKALELIEAYWLFGLEMERIEVLVHPQSIVHSAVNFSDGAQLAQLSYPDMRGSISFAINFPSGRLPGAVRCLDLSEIGTLEFYPVDDARFPAIRLAKSALGQGGLAPALFNAANEVAVAEFLSGRVRFDQIFSISANAMEKIPSGNFSTMDELIKFDSEVRCKIQEELGCFI